MVHVAEITNGVRQGYNYLSSLAHTIAAVDLASQGARA